MVFLEKNTSPSEIDKIKNLLNERKIKEWRFVDEEIAKKEFMDKFPELSHFFKELGESPFPPAFVLKVEKNKEEDLDLLRDSLRNLPSVAQIHNSADLSRQFAQIGRIIVLIGMFFSSILFVASVFTIFNTIRLNLVYYKDIIEILRLVGASLSFVKFPFYLLGLCLGLAGGMLAIIFMFVVARALISYISPFLSMIKSFFPFSFLPFTKLIQILGISVAISFLTTWFSIKSYMK